MELRHQLGGAAWLRHARAFRRRALGLAWAVCVASAVFASTGCGSPASPAGEPPSDKVSLLFGGDLLMHPSLADSVRDGATGHHDFSRIFSPIAPRLAAADLSVANLETVLAGAGRGYSGYPRMNSPDDLAGELREAGLDVVATANNHALDQGWDGLVHTAGVLDAAGLAHVGAYRSATERAAPRVLEVRGIRVALLAYTDALNGLPLPPGRPYAVALLDRSQVVEDVRRAREAGAEVVVAMVHWGSEYMREPSGAQRVAAGWLVQEGVDLVVGSHPHVVQPVEAFAVQREGKPSTAYVAYSLGNLVSTQTWRYTDSGILLSVQLERASGDVGGQVKVSAFRYVPVYVQRAAEASGRAYRVVPVGADADASAPRPSEVDRRRMAQVEQELTALLGAGPGSVLSPIPATPTPP